MPPRGVLGGKGASIIASAILWREGIVTAHIFSDKTRKTKNRKSLERDDEF
jgi:hypothetical protein